MTGLMYALLALIPIGFGLSDFLGGRLSTRINPIAVTGATCAVSAVGALVWSAATHSLGFSAAAVGWGALSGILLMSGMALFYAALARGKGGVVGAVVTLSVIVPMLSDAVRGHLPTAWGILGILAIMAGVIIMSVSEGGSGGEGRQAILLAAAAAVLLGVQYVTLDHASTANSDTAVLWQFIAATLVVLVLAAVKRSVGGIERRDLPRLAIVGLLFTAASLLFSMSLVTVNPAIASAVMNMEPAVLAVCGLVVLKEKLSLVQWAALAVVLAGAAVAVILG